MEQLVIFSYQSEELSHMNDNNLVYYVEFVGQIFAVIIGNLLGWIWMKTLFLSSVELMALV